MAGAFRDDDLAARQRADALEQRVQALEAEKQALTEQLARKPYTPSQKKALPIALLPLLLGGLLLLATGATAGRVPVRFLAGGVVLLAAVLGAVMMRQLLRARPGELWVISGGPATPRPDGSVVGYRLLRPGEQRFLIPFMELATSMSLRPFPVNTRVEQVFAPGGETWTLEASLLLKLDPTNPHGAVERFLGQPEEAIARLGREVLEGALRETAAHQAPGDRERLREQLEETLGENLSKLGLAVETILALDARRISG
jgi:uncharacterized membrane protein YqiK